MKSGKNRHIALENVNMLVINEKLSKFIEKQGAEATEDKCRLVQMVLRHKIHHFPIDIPFIAAVKNCGEGQVAVFNIKRTKLALISGHSVAAETLVNKSFEINGVEYALADTINGFSRYKPMIKSSGRYNKIVEIPDEV